MRLELQYKVNVFTFNPDPIFYAMSSDVGWMEKSKKTMDVTLYDSCSGCGLCHWLYFSHQSIPAEM